MLKINFQIRSPKFQEITKDYINEKLSKLEKLIRTYEEITVKIYQVNSSRGSFLEFRANVTIKMPHAFIKVQGNGSNINTIIDKLITPLKKKLERYLRQGDRWTKNKEWKVKQYLPDIVEEVQPSMLIDNFEPVIKYSQYDDDTPLHPAQAVEKMELLGHNCYLFKNIENNRHAMVCKLKKGGYELIQPRI